MRNLKRALSLTLASVMLLGMMVVGTSAAAGYDDVSKTDNVEAIEVLQTIEVMVGDERGFGPDRPVNRAEMAVVMGKLLNLDYNYYATSCPFNDVYDWARGWVGACYANKIVSGRGDGVYDPGATVTAVEAASMLMRALGYFQYANDVADGFELATVRQGTIIGIFDGVGSSATEPMTRNQVAQMVLNALKSAVVEPDGNTINLTTPDGTVLTGKVNYVSVTSRKDFAYAISTTQATSVGSTNDGAIVELGERLYNGDLKLHDFQVDEFGRPSRQWEYKGTDIGTYEKKELLRKEYTVEVTGKDLYDLLTKSTIDDYAFRLTVDGEVEQDVLTRGDNSYFTENNLIRTNTKGVGATGKGVLTRVYVDTTVGRETIYVAIINTYLAKATDDYSEKREEARFDVYGVQDILNGTGIQLVKNTGDSDGLPNNGIKVPYTENLIVKNEDINVESVKKDDFFLVHVAEGEIKEMIDPETIDSTTISSFKNGDWVNAEGTQYDYDDTALYDPEVLDRYDNTNMKDTSYRIVLDEYGYAIGLEIIEEPNKFVFLTGIDGNTSNLTNKTADGNVIHLDGTMETVKINMTDSRKVNSAGAWVRWETGDLSALMNTWCRYTVDGNGVYTLTEIAKNTASFTANRNKNGQGKNLAGNVNDAANDILTLDKSHLTLNGIQGVTDDPSGTSTVKRVYADDDTVFLLAETDRIRADNPARNVAVISDVDSVATGIQNVNMKVWNPAKVQADDTTKYGSVALGDIVHGAHTLFDNDGVVIATVVVGEDEGTTSSYAFVYSGSMKQEDYNSENNTWTWYRDVIINGEQTTLVEKRASNPRIGTMLQGEWYEVKYNAAGEVRSVRGLSNAVTGRNVSDPANPLPANDFDGYASPWVTANDKFVKDINDVQNALDNKNTVLLWQDLTGLTGYRLRVSNNTLYIDTASGPLVTRGITMTADAKSVLIQDTRRSDRTAITQLDEKYYHDNGGRGVETALKELNENSNFYGYVGAVFENGRATSVVIWDMTETVINVGSNRPVTREGIYNVDTSTPSAVMVNYTGANAPSFQAMIDAIIAQLRSEGREISGNGVYSDGSYYYFPTSGGGYPLTYRWDPSAAGRNQVVSIRVNGKETPVDYNASLGIQTLATAAGVSAANRGDYAKVTMKDGTTVNWVDTSADTNTVDTTGTTDATIIADIEFGYYDVTIGSVTNSASNATSATLAMTADTTNKSGSTVYLKKTETSVALTLTNSGTTTTGALSLAPTAGVGSVTSGASVATGLGAASPATTSHKLVVTLTEANITAGDTIALTATNLATQMRVTVNVNGVAHTADILDSDNWGDILNKAGLSVSEINTLATAGDYIRDDADWSKADQFNSVTKAVGNITLANNGSYTVGAKQVGKGALTGLATSGTVTITTGDNKAWTATNVYMVKDDTYTVAVDVSKENSGAGLTASGTTAVTITLTAANATVAAPTIAGFTAAAAAGTDKVIAGAADATNKIVTLTITGAVANDVIATGTVSWSVTVGATVDTTINVAAANVA